VLGTFGRPLDTFANFKYSLPLFNAFFKIGSTFPRGTHSTLSKLLNPRFAVPAAMMFGVVDWLRCPAGDVKEYIEHLVARDLSLLLILARDMADRSLKHVLPQIKVPTLIFAGGLDAFAPPQIAGEMRSLIPGNEFVCVDGGTHVALVEHPEVLATAVSRFLKSNGIC
jgi:pimeloyl-ACP methyl ester carboxylesterase